MVTLGPTARALLDTAAYQRLRRIRQLGMASTVYPSAVHTRFEHAVGAYHLAGTVLDQLAERGELAGLPAEEPELIRLAVLLHDLGHHPGAHLLEEFRYPGVCHEASGEVWFTAGNVGEILGATGIADAGTRIAALVRGTDPSPLRGVVSGPCDADKLDYLARDAYHCGLPAGFDLHYLRGGLTLVTDPRAGGRELGIEESALTAFEQMVYAKNVLYRSVYFHPTVRSAMAMLRVVLVASLEAELLGREELLAWTDEELFTVLRLRLAGAAGGRRWRRDPPGDGGASAELRATIGTLVGRLLHRDLYKTAASLPLSDAPALTPAAVARAEREIERRLGLARHEAILDVPRKPTMLATEILVRCDDGSVVAASELEARSGFALNVAKASLYEASGRVQVLTSRRTTLAPADLGAILRAV